MRKNVEPVPMLLSTCPFWLTPNTLYERNITKNLVHQEGKQVWGAEGCKSRLETVAWAGWEMLEIYADRSLSWALLESLRELLSSFLFEKQSRNLKKGFCENADANFLIDFPWQGWISAHYFRKQNVVSALPSLQKKAVCGEKTWEKSSGSRWQKRMHWKSTKNQ